MKSKTKFFGMFLVGIFFITLASASSFYIPEDTNYSIRFNCELNGAVCTDSATCNVSIEYPNSTTLINNSNSTSNGNSRFSFPLNTTHTNFVGEDYSLTMTCYDGDLNGTTTTLFGINPSGIPPSTERTDTISRSIYFFFIIGVLLFVGFLFTKQSVPVKWSFFGVSILFFLIGINTIFVSLQDEIVNPSLETFFSGFTTIFWYLWWFIAGLLIFMWIFTFMNTYIMNKNLRNAKRYGLA